MSINKLSGNVLWSIVEGFSAQIIQFLVGLVIARLVSPSDFGLIAMLTVFIAIAQVFVDSGLSKALIHKQNRTQTDFSTIFIFNIVLSILIYLVLVLAAPYIAHFYNEDILKNILNYTAFSIVISSSYIVQRTLLIINGNFKKLAVITSVSSLISGIIGIALAYKGYGVWALVAQNLSNQLLIAIILWTTGKWAPKCKFSFSALRPMLNYGYKILISGLMNVVFVNLYTLVIGKFYSARQVGFYNRANMFAQFPSTYLTTYIVRGLFPIQCEIRNNAEQLNLCYSYIKSSTYFIFPIMMTLCGIAAPLINFLLTDKWAGTIVLLQILCIAYMWRPIMAINEILNAQGKSDLFLKSETVKKIGAIILLAASLPFGVKTLCFSLLIYSFFDMYVIIYYVKKVIDLKIKQILKLIVEPLGISLVMMLLTLLPQYIFTSYGLQLCIGLVLAAIFYGGWTYMRHHSQWNKIFSSIKNNIL